jgi:TolB-like protein
MVRAELETPADPAVAAQAERISAELGARDARAPAAAPAPPLAATPSEARGDAPASAAAAPNEPAAPGTPGVGHPAAAPPPPTAPSPGRPWSSARRVTAAAALTFGAALGAFVLQRPAGTARAPAAAETARRSIAVLPFVDMSADSGNGYFGDGLSEELITALSHVGELRVAARTSSFALRDSRLDVRAIGETLRVATVVEGSVRRDGGRLRVTAQLIDAATGYHLWSGEYDRELEDVFAVQDDIAQAIAGALKLELASGGAYAAGRTTNLKAYDLYLRGTFYRNLLSREALTIAVEYFDSAIAIDSGFALAYAGKATAIGPMLYFDLMPRDEALPAMRAAARRALELDDRLGEAHTASGIISFFYEWDWPAAERSFRRATELSPNDAHSFHHLANWLRAMGRSEEGIAARRRSLALDPLNPRTHITLAGDYAAAGRDEEAAEHYRRAQAIDPLNPLVLGLGPHLPGGRGRLLEARGDSAGAVEEYLAIAARRGASPADHYRLRRAFAAHGMPGFWRAWADFDEAHSPGGPNPLRLSSAWLRAGDTARAITMLERAYRERNPGLVYFAVDRNWLGMHDHPRVAAILDAMKLPR